VASVVIFTIEYLVRFYLAPEDEEFKKHRFARAKYATSPFAIIDLIAILPFFLQAFISIDLRYLAVLATAANLETLPSFNSCLQRICHCQQRPHLPSARACLVFPSAYGGELHHIYRLIHCGLGCHLCAWL
jgi:voltage-gated potassium channel